MSERVLAGWSGCSTPAPVCVLSHSTHLTLFNITLTHTASYTTKRLKKIDVVCTVCGFIRAKTRDTLDHLTHGIASSEEKKYPPGNIAFLHILLGRWSCNDVIFQTSSPSGIFFWIKIGINLYTL